MNQAFLDYFRCPERFANFQLAEDLHNGKPPGYSEFGADLARHGSTDYEKVESEAGSLHAALGRVKFDGRICILPFDPTEIANNLRYERYVSRESGPFWKRLIHKTYYALRPAFPVFLRRHFQRRWLKGWDRKPFPRWPVDSTVDQMFHALMRLALQASQQVRIPFVWFWPEGKTSCAIVTHDVETASGLKFAGELMDMNDAFGIKTSFQIIPDARYVADEKIRSAIRQRGFEVNVHDLRHDGHLFDSREKFQQSAARINEFIEHFGSKGYRSGALYRNLEWYDSFTFSYDMSVPNVAHLDPQPGGCCTVMPYFVNGILELPVTATQDYSLFNILQTYSLDLWREQIALIMKQHGMVSFIVHPDYLNKPEARQSYTALLDYLSSLRAEANMWIPLPGDVDSWWRKRNAMKLVPHETGWSIEGPGAERARVAYAMLENNELTFQIQ
jgi:hypothetical protein